MTTYYKVVMEREPGKLTSSSVHERYRTQYTPGEWAEAPIPGSGLFVFKTLAQAKGYIQGNAVYYQIWECECEEPVTLPRPFLAFADSVTFMERYWKGCSIEIFSRTLKPITGTLLFKRVRLTKKV